MASVLKRCGCPRSAWSKCPHSWTVRWWGTDGRQHEKSFKRNHKLASAFAREAEADKQTIHRGNPAPPVSLKTYAGTWLANFDGAANTRKTYDSALRIHILPAFGHRPLADVAADREGVQALLSTLTPTLAHNVIATLRSMLNEAEASGRIESDRLRRLRAGHPAPLQFTFPAHEQLTRLARGMGEQLTPAIWIMRGCGLRPSEMLAVRGKPDRAGGPGFSSGRLRISEQQAEDRTLIPLKARRPGEFRDVPVPGYVTAAIAGLGPGRLFDICGPAFRDRFRKAANAAGLEGFRAHDLRHVFASVALSGGVPVTDVSRWLGHRNIQTTYQIYSHFIPDSWDQARDVLDAEYEKWSAG